MSTPGRPRAASSCARRLVRPRRGGPLRVHAAVSRHDRRSRGASVLSRESRGSASRQRRLLRAGPEPQIPEDHLEPLAELMRSAPPVSRPGAVSTPKCKGPPSSRSPSSCSQAALDSPTHRATGTGRTRRSGTQHPSRASPCQESGSAPDTTPDTRHGQGGVVRRHAIGALASAGFVENQLPRPTPTRLPWWSRCLPTACFSR
jgi:hypothetical protein